MNDPDKRLAFVGYDHGAVVVVELHWLENNPEVTLERLDLFAGYARDLLDSMIETHHA